jgi:hypothetical protein
MVGRRRASSRCAGAAEPGRTSTREARADDERDAARPRRESARDGSEAHPCARFRARGRSRRRARRATDATRIDFLGRCERAAAMIRGGCDARERAAVMTTR